MPGLERRIEWILDALRRRGFEAGKPLPSGACHEMAVKTGGGVVFAYIYPGRYSDAAIVKLSVNPSDCHRALLDPRGLYAIVESEEDAEKLPGKVERLLTVAKRLGW